MLPRPKPEDLAFNPSGRDSVITRMKLLYGDSVTVLKAKRTAFTAQTLINHKLTPAQVRTLFGTVLYPDWAGEPNNIVAESELVYVETNRATCYLVFRT